MRPAGLPEQSPGVEKALARGEEDQGGEDPGNGGDVTRKDEEQHPSDDGLEALGEGVAKVEPPLGEALGLQPLQNAGEGKEEAAVEVVGEEERHQGEARLGVLNGEGHYEAAVHEEVSHDVQEGTELRGLAPQAGHLPVEAVEQAVEEPEEQRGDVEAEGYRKKAEHACPEARGGEGVAGDAPAGEGTSEGTVEWLGAPAELLVEHPPIIAAGASPPARTGQKKEEVWLELDPRTVRWVRFALTLAVLAAIGLAYLFSAGFRSEVDRALAILGRGDVAALRDYILSFGAWAPIVSALLMVLQALAAPLPAFAIAFANGLAFGIFWGGLLSLASATLAAALAFWISRLLGRGPVEAVVGSGSLGSADRFFARWGVYAILILRLVPVVSFDVISYAAGLTRMRFSGFVLATAAGAAPASFVYAYLGGRAPQYVWVLLIAFSIVIAGALVAAVLRRRRSGKHVPLTEEVDVAEGGEQDL